MANEDDSLVMVFNGEIYNSPELRRRCEAKGHRFRSRMDGEVILHLYEDEGIRAFERLNGIFAVALASRETGEVVLARDAVGVKPLFYCLDEGQLWFGSEIAAVQAAGAPPGRPDLVALAQFLSFMWVPGPRTPFDNIRSLEPGGVLRWARGRSTRGRHTDLVAEAIAADVMVMPPDTTEVVDRIRDAVHRQLLSDVPIGVMASGGVDSSLVWWATDHAVDTAFTIHWAGQGSPEGTGEDEAAAEMLARRWGTELVEVPAPLQASPVPMPSGDLIADSAAELTRLIAIAAKDRGMKVLFSGQGGDEIFGGYRRHVIAPILERVPSGSLFHRIFPAVERLGSRWLSAEYLVRLLKAASNPDPMARYLSLSTYSDPAQRARALGCTESEVADDVVGQCHAEVWDRMPTGWSMLRKGRLLDLTVYLPGLGLAYVDRAAMAEGVEVRVPFLDMELVRWSLRLPDKALVRHGQGKILTKAAAAEHISRRIAYRPKRGFGLPSVAIGGPPEAGNFRQTAYFDHAAHMVAAHLEAARPA
jgi:asparagine synthase (glutamine-hydrolysing)